MRLSYGCGACLVFVIGCGDTFIPSQTTTSSGQGGAAAAATVGVGGAGGTTSAVTGGMGGASAAMCGNGELEGSEECDDGNTEPADGCTPDCRIPKCGDGKLDAGETCFKPATNVDMPGQGIEDFVLVDCDEDNDLDVIGTSYAYAALGILRNEGGSGTLGGASGPHYLAAEVRGIDAGRYQLFNAPQLGLAFNYSSYNVGVMLDKTGPCTYAWQNPKEVAPINPSTTKMGGTVVFVAMDGAGSFKTLVFGAEKGIVWIEPENVNAKHEDTLASAPKHMLAADMTDDGREDLVLTTTANGGDTIAIYPSNGSKIGFGIPSAMNLGGVISAVALGPMNDDMRADLVLVTGAESKTIKVIANPSSGVLAEASLVTAPSGDISDLAVADIDGDGALDVLAVHGGSSGGVDVFRGDGGGNLTYAATLSSAGDGIRIQLADMNGDGFLDIVLAHTWKSNASPGEISVILADP